MNLPTQHLTWRRVSSMTIGFMMATGLMACSSEDKTPTTGNAEGSVAVSSNDTMAKCGRVSIANMNWQSAEVLAHIDKIILEKGFGCEVDLVPGDSVPTGASMTEKGEPDIAPELWLNSVREPIEKAVAENRLHIAGKSLIEGGTEGFWVPKYFMEAHPDIKTIADALNHPELFPSAENEKMGAIYGCPAGWACEITTKQAFKAWNAAKKGFKLIDPGSAAGLDGAIAMAYERRKPWLGYYWSPTSILGKYEMVRLDPGVPFDLAQWERCNLKPDCPDPVPNAWKSSEVLTVATDRFKKAGGEAYTYLTKRSFHNDTMNKLLAWMSDKQASGEDGALYFLQNHREHWEKWVDTATANKIKAAIDAPLTPAK